jgi:hypothetical protein
MKWTIGCGGQRKQQIHSPLAVIQNCNISFSWFSSLVGQIWFFWPQFNFPPNFPPKLSIFHATWLLKHTKVHSDSEYTTENGMYMWRNTTIHNCKIVWKMYWCNPASLVLEDCKIHLERQSIPPKSQVCEGTSDEGGIDWLERWDFQSS